MDFLHLYKLLSNKNGYLFLLGESGQVYRSRDAGLSWERLFTPYEGSFFGGLRKDSDGSIYIYGLSGVVLKSLDNGDSWLQIQTNTSSILQDATIIDGDRVALVGLGGILLVENQQASSFTIQNIGARSAPAAVLAGNDNQLLVVGKEGLRLFAGVGKKDDDSIQRVGQPIFVFNKRDNAPDPVND
uniref:WD40/YVTN/BNR-like repeat-containing protein n=1 Tax=Comamonas sp. 7D-2 TaxID=1232667 RepID=UPI00156341A1|nr:hypothetical protein [Comamonas sp. 7D-2]